MSGFSVTIYVDTNPLIALVNSHDPLHAVARQGFARLRRHELRLTTPVLVETLHYLVRADQRARLLAILEEHRILPALSADETFERLLVFDWLARYAEHAPDYTDAHLCVISANDRRAKIWTYDQEFATIWRRPDGSRIPLAIRLS